MTEKPTFAEMEKRIRRAVSEHGGSLPREHAIVWSGYLAALIEWGLISVDEHSRLTGLLPEVADDPVMKILLGYDR